MTAYESARIESRVFGRPVDAETVERLLDHIDNLTEELKASEKLAGDRNKRWWISWMWLPMSPATWIASTWASTSSTKPLRSALSPSARSFSMLTKWLRSVNSDEDTLRVIRIIRVMPGSIGHFANYANYAKGWLGFPRR